MNWITQIALPAALALIMFAMGLGLTVADFKRVVVQPKDFVVGTILQMAALPLTALAIVAVWPLAPVLAVGVMLLAACPGGVTSNLLTHISRGDVALSISLTAVISVLSVVTVPLILGGALDLFMGTEAPDLPILRTVIGIFVITTVPVVLGMVVKHFFPPFARWADERSRLLSTIVFIAVVAGAVISSRENLVAYFAAAGPVALVLNVAMMFIAFGTAGLFNLRWPQKVAVTIECGFQNATLAIVIGTTMLGDVRFAIPGAIYGLLMFGTGFGFSAIARRGVAAEARSKA